MEKKTKFPDVVKGEQPCTPHARPCACAEAKRKVFAKKFGTVCASQAHDRAQLSNYRNRRIYAISPMGPSQAPYSIPN